MHYHVTMSARHYTFIDHLITQFDRGLSAALGEQHAARANPAQDLAEPALTSSQQRHSAALMRINHCGEICAQALYHAQALVARSSHTRSTLAHAAAEETDHLAWTHQRLRELNSHRSYLGLLWYWNSFVIGLIAGSQGDALSLGFVEETEVQVGKHLAGHLSQLQDVDEKSTAIIRQMQHDEAQHAEQANLQGAQALPTFIKQLMHLQGKVMTTLSYWV